MKFKTLKEAYDKFDKYTLVDLESMPVCEYYWTSYINKPVMGDWMLFRHITDGENMDEIYISRPRLALVVGHTVWDQALVLEYVEDWRGWQVNSEVLNTNTNCYFPVFDRNKEVKHIQFWTDDIIVLGKWKTKPSFREIRKVYK